MPPSFGRFVLRKMTRGIVQGLRDAGDDIHRQALINAPVGEQRVDRGTWRKRRVSTGAPREWGFRKSTPLRATSYKRNIRNGVEVGFRAPHAARLEFGMDDHYESVDEYFRRVRRSGFSKTTRRRRRVVAYQSVRSYRRFVPASGGRRYLGNAVDAVLSNLDDYIVNALQNEFSTGGL